MTWQEELRKLDEDLAAGNISADDYRVRRDQVLSSAVSPDGQTSQAPQAPANSGESDNASATQVINPVQPQGGNQHGQPADAAATASPPSARPAQAPHAWRAQQQPWNAPEQDASPPWGGGDLPPMGNQESPWVSQGPESFDSTSSGGKGRKALLSALGVVVVLGLCVAVWALFLRPGGSGSTPAAAPPSQQPVQQPPSLTRSPLPEPPAAKEEPADNASALVEPEGDPRDGGGEFDLDSLRERKLLPEPVIAALDEAGMTEGLLKTTTAGESMVGLYSLEVESEQAARTVAHEYAIAQQEGGLPATRELSMKGVPVFGTDTGDNPVYRAVYVVYDRVIVVGVYGKDAQAVTDLFTGLLDKQVNHAPPTVREPF